MTKHRTEQSLLAQYLNIAKNKIIKSFLICTAILCVVMYALGIALYFAKRNSEFDTSGMGSAALWVIPGAMCFSIFILVLAVYTEVAELQRFRRTFERLPFSELATRGFVRATIFERSMWKIYKEVRTAVVNGYTVVANNPAKGNISFTVLTDREVKKLPVLPEGERGVILDRRSAGLVITVSDNSLHTPSGQQLMLLMEVATRWLNGEGYAPGVDMRNYEAMIRRELMMQGVRGGLGV